MRFWGLMAQSPVLGSTTDSSDTVRHHLGRISLLFLTDKAGLSLDSLRYLPVIARQEWIALLDDKGRVLGFLQGDGW